MAQYVIEEWTYFNEYIRRRARRIQAAGSEPSTSSHMPSDTKAVSPTGGSPPPSQAPFTPASAPSGRPGAPGTQPGEQFALPPKSEFRTVWRWLWGSLLVLFLLILAGLVFLALLNERSSLRATVYPSPTTAPPSSTSGPSTDAEAVVTNFTQFQQTRFRSGAVVIARTCTKWGWVALGSGTESGQLGGEV